MSKTTTAAEIIAAAHETADEIARVYAAKTRIMHDGATIAASALTSAKGTKNVDRLFELAATATAAAAAADDANNRAYTDAQLAGEYVLKARRTAAAYKAAATRAGYSAETVAKRDAAEQAMKIIADAYSAAESERRTGNRAMNNATRDASEVIKTAKYAAAAEAIRTHKYATAADAAEAIRRELDSRTEDIDATTRDWRRATLDNATAAARVAAYAFATEAEQAAEDELAERDTKIATTRTRHMNIGEKKQQAHTVTGANGWSARVSYAPQIGNHITCDWRVEVYRNGIYICHDIFWTIEEAEAYAEAMTSEPKAEQNAAELEEIARNEWQEPGYYTIFADGIEWTNNGPTWYETASDLAQDLATAISRASMPESVSAELVSVQEYQRHELEAYLGEPDDYDMDAIEDEATRWSADGKLIWTAFGDDLAAIAERHQIVDYYPAV